MATEEIKRTNLVILKAVHESMCTDTAWAEEGTAVDAVSNGVPARHAAGAHDVTATHVQDVASIQHHDVQRQAGHVATVGKSITLVTQRTLQHATRLLLDSRAHQTHNARRTEHMQTR